MLIKIVTRKFKLPKVPFLHAIIILLVYEVISYMWIVEKNILVYISGLKIDFFYFPIIFIIPYVLKERRFTRRINSLSSIFLFVLFITQIVEVALGSFASSLKFYSISDDYDKVFHLGHSTDASGVIIKYYKSFFFSSAKFSDAVLHLFLLNLITAFLLEKIQTKKLIFNLILSLLMIIICGKRIFILLFPLLVIVLIYSIGIYKKQIIQHSLNFYLSLKKLQKSLMYFIYFCFSSIFIFFSYNEYARELFYFIYKAVSVSLVERFFTSGTHYGKDFNRLISEGHLWYGQGVGTNTQGRDVFMKTGVEYSSYEMGLMKFVNEHGLAGLFFLIIFIFNIFIFNFKTFKITKVILDRISVLTISVYHFIILLRYFNGPSFFGSTATVLLFWVIMGIQLHFSLKGNYIEKKNFSL